MLALQTETWSSRHWPHVDAFRPKPVLGKFSATFDGESRHVGHPTSAWEKKQQRENVKNVENAKHAKHQHNGKHAEHVQHVKHLGKRCGERRASKVCGELRECRGRGKGKAYEGGEG